ncbi:MAG: DNA polymerase I [bacterium]|nr:DNA polymerase I [bacterium]
MTSRFLIVDGNSLIHRGFHAIPHLSTKKGEPTNGVYGFAMLFLRAIKDLKPEYVAVAFDLPGPTFRDKLYEPYKAHRVAAPQELYDQIPRVKELVRAFNLPTFELLGYEADDLIGSLAELAKKVNDTEVIILTGDLDALQLVSENVKVFTPRLGLGETKLYDETAVIERFGIRPSQLIDYKALRGDPSDNIPGVKGIGEKTAVELLQKYSSLEGVYKNLSEIKPRIARLLSDHHEDAGISKKLAEIVRNLKFKFDLESARLAKYDEAKVVKLFQELEFRSLLDKLPSPLSSHTSGEELKEGAKNKTGIGYKLIASKEDYKKFHRELQNQKEIAIDTETTSINPIEAKLLGIGIGWTEGEAYYVPAKQIDNQLKSILQDQAVKKIGHNIKYDFLVLKGANIDLAGMAFDTMIAAYELNPGARNFDLDSLSFNEFGFRKTEITALIGEGKNQINMSEVPVEKVSDYCCEDVDYTLRLKNKLIIELKSQKLEKIFYEIDIPLIPVLAAMEHFGIKVDTKVLQELSKEATQVVGKLQAQIWRLSGEEFNIGSTLQLKEILFEKLGIPTETLKRGKTGLSTAATELEKLRGLHPIIDLLFEWRELTKLKNTYLDALPKLINKQTDRVHTSYNQTIAATGRLSSTDPNLQNIPIRTEFGRKIRRAFVAQKKYKLVSVDYSQIELRLAAHVSGDENMIKVFQEGGDIHEATAKAVGNIDRRLAKTINFAVLYGASSYGISSRIPGVSKAQADDFIKKYFEAYPKVTAWLKDTIEQTKKQGYVKNELGRVRFLPEINSSQFQVRAGAERAAINMPLQSLAADIIKMAMNKLGEENLTSGDDCRLLLQVHDELVFEIWENKVENFVPKITKIMSEIYKLKVPLLAEAKVGDNWEEMSPTFFPLDKGEIERG